ARAGKRTAHGKRGPAVTTKGGGGATTHPGSGTTSPSGPALQCAAGHNGGATDQGVTATQIRMATTVVDSGVGASVLRDVRFAMEAVRNQIDRSGGVCGRQLAVQYVDDGWDA